MTPAEVSDALVAAVGAAVADGELDVAVPGEALVFAREAGVFESPVALVLGVEPAVIAKRVGGTVTGRGFVRVEMPAADVVGAILRDPGYGTARVPAHVWDDRPRTFANPGFAVRYAYARACWTGRWARELGIGEGLPESLADVEKRLVGVLADVPGRAAQAEREGDAGPLAFCLERVAGAYHDVHERCPAVPLGDEKPGAVHAGRAGLARAVRIALGNGLKMFGETPRERI
ncbi:DALR anticodon-binding domain-containing protein [Actinomadura violacea]|uniref:Anticodon-binding protein n=1 Tax=Actinomadura violacea TaxID=2819934 RepID=A0ABS3RIG9_9ACTN|nr:DALR anticodon-binding domain-containing protein [Actinomadura violacea]MBO2456539.1 anticodon-binding protein [Actinomadura violacea]